ncbi:MAG TPA: Hpt domain-containing protein [Xanthobacteraceae bacterium]|nr:Hpt domain-containing protein [Xanthobacteraceae bacterium]
MIEQSQPVAEDISTMPKRSFERPIDLIHLSRITLGDPGLEREVLQLFDRQTDMLMTRMRQSTPGAIAAVAHTLKGSARGIGAWRVAHAAEEVEIATNSDEQKLRSAVGRLSVAAAEVRSVIDELLRAN